METDLIVLAPRAAREILRYLGAFLDAGPGADARLLLADRLREISLVLSQDGDSGLAAEYRALADHVAAPVTVGSPPVSCLFCATAVHSPADAANRHCDWCRTFPDEPPDRRSPGAV